MKTTQLINGKWLRPDTKTLLKYFVIFSIGLLINYSLKALLYNASSQRIPLFLGINLESSFKRISNPLAFDIIASGLLTAWFLFLPLLFRLSQRWLDEWWLKASALMFAGYLSTMYERIFTGGLRYVFSVTHGLRYLCI